MFAYILSRMSPREGGSSGSSSSPLFTTGMSMKLKRNLAKLTAGPFSMAASAGDPEAVGSGGCGAGGEVFLFRGFMIFTTLVWF